MSGIKLWRGNTLLFRNLCAGSAEVPSCGLAALLKIAGLLCWILVSATAANAHATLLHVEPLPGAKLAEAPAEVSLSFNERVETVFNSIRVVDAHGHRVDQGHATTVGEGEEVKLDLQPLADGPYAVFWKINSADGHQVQGSFGFGVRADPPDEKSLLIPANPAETFVTQWYRPAVKWIALTAMVLWLGGICFLLAVFGPATAEQGPAIAERAPAVLGPVLGLIWCASLAFLVAECLGLAGQAVTMADAPLLDSISPAVLGVVLTSTNYGTWWMVRVASGLALVGACYGKLRLARWKEDSRGRIGFAWKAGMAVLGGLMLLSIPLSGHAGAVRQWTAVAVGVDWLHLAATAIWIGGLVCFAATALVLKRQEWNVSIGLLSSIAKRFSNVARICVLVLLATGIYSTWLHLPSLLAFFTTNYGRVLLAKISVIVPILIIAAVNWKRVLPALAAYRTSASVAEKWARRFRRLLPAEAALGVVVLALVAVLTNLPPATAAIAPGPATLSQRGGGMTINLKMDPNRVGANRAAVTLTDSQGQDISGAKRVTLYLRSEDMDMGLETVQAVPSSDGTYKADVSLSMAGRWAVSVEVSPPQGDTFVAEFKLSL